MPAIYLPQAVQGMTTATVKGWLKQPGAPVRKGDVLVELETERDLIQIEAPADGTLGRIIAPAGVTVAAGADLALIESSVSASRDRQGAGPLTSPPQASSNQTSAHQALPPQGRGSSDAPASARPGGPVVAIVMPQAGNTMEEGTVVAWKVREGDAIAIGQVICDIETDKAVMEFESPAAGRLARIVVPAGGTAPVKTPIAYLAASSADVDAFLAGGGAPVAPGATVADPAQSPAAAATSTPATATLTPGGRVKASPAARRMAQEKRIDLATVAAGSGPGGRILSTDLAKGATAATKTAPTAVPAGSAGGAVRRPMSKMRRAIALNLQASKQTVPHFYVRLTIDARKLLDYYRAQKPATGCTINDVVTLACARLIGQTPMFRSRVDGNDVVEFPHANIGIAVGVEDGLVVPVVLAAETMALKQLAGESRRVVEAARKGRLENIGQGVFTISNLGMFGVEEFAAIINPPEAAILAVSAARPAAVVRDGMVAAGQVMTMTLSVDHRVVDGVAAAKFADALRKTLENPESLA
jgi:pyruvate dehydrogenase E2 component (dihydrolipoamide acetyltransferase)